MWKSYFKTFRLIASRTITWWWWTTTTKTVWWFKNTINWYWKYLLPMITISIKSIIDDWLLFIRYSLPMNPLRNTLSRGHLYYGDCIEVMQKFSSESFDMILTDPPYVARYQDREGRSLHGDFSFDWIVPATKQMARVLKTHGVMISFYGWHHVERFMSAWKDVGLQPVGHLVFPKSYASKTGYLRYQHECAYVLVHKNADIKPNFIMSDVRDWKYSGNILHPTQKPVKPLIRLIECFTKEGGLVLDPFMGSGSSLVAARSCNRRSVGIEIDSKYFESAKRRLQYRGSMKSTQPRKSKKPASPNVRGLPQRTKSSSTSKQSKSLAQNA
jgi:site-specific DNA-methyltransferase (adenine-specific)